MEEMKLAKSEFQSTLVFAFKHLVVLIKHLHSRDSRNNFTPDNHWIADIEINADKLNQIYKCVATKCTGAKVPIIPSALVKKVFFRITYLEGVRNWMFTSRGSYEES